MHSAAMRAGVGNINSAPQVSTPERFARVPGAGVDARFFRPRLLTRRLLCTCDARAKPDRKLTISSRFLFCFCFLWFFFYLMGLLSHARTWRFSPSPPCAFLLARFFYVFFPGLPDHQHRCGCRTWRNARVRMEAAGPAARAWALEVAAFGLEFQESRDSRYPRGWIRRSFGTTR